jgi:hypothetical protein
MTKKQIVEQCTKQILIDAKLRNRKIGQENRADWDKSIKEAEFRIGLVPSKKKERRTLHY